MAVLVGEEPEHIVERHGQVQVQLAALVENGADIIEIGVPFSDPMADGPVIAAAGLRALAAGASLAKILALVAALVLAAFGAPLMVCVVIVCLIPVLPVVVVETVGD